MYMRRGRRVCPKFLCIIVEITKSITPQQNAEWILVFDLLPLQQNQMKIFKVSTQTVRNHRCPRNNSSVQTAFHAHTHTRTYTHGVPITQTNILTPTNIQHKLRGTRVPNTSRHSIVQMSHFSSVSRLQNRLSHDSCGLGHDANTKQQWGFVTLHVERMALKKKKIRVKSENAIHTNVRWSWSPLPGRETLFTRNTGRRT